MAVGERGGKTVAYIFDAAAKVFCTSVGVFCILNFSFLALSGDVGRAGPCVPCVCAKCCGLARGLKPLGASE